MKFTYNDLSNKTFMSAIVKLSDNATLPIPVVLKLADTIELIKAQSVKYKGILKDIFSEYGDPNKDGNFSIKKENAKLVADKIEELHKQEAGEIELIIKIKEGVKFNLSANEINAIKHVITIENE